MSSSFRRPRRLSQIGAYAPAESSKKHKQRGASSTELSSSANKQPAAEPDHRSVEMDKSLAEGHGATESDSDLCFVPETQDPSQMFSSETPSNSFRSPFTRVRESKRRKTCEGGGMSQAAMSQIASSLPDAAPCTSANHAASQSVARSSASPLGFQLQKSKSRKLCAEDVFAAVLCPDIPDGERVEQRSQRNSSTMRSMDRSSSRRKPSESAACNSSDAARNSETDVSSVNKDCDIRILPQEDIERISSKSRDLNVDPFDVTSHCTQDSDDKSKEKPQKKKRKLTRRKPSTTSSTSLGGLAALFQPKFITGRKT